MTWACVQVPMEFVGKKNSSKMQFPRRLELQKCRQPPGFEGVPVALHGAFCIAFFKLISFVGGRGGPKDHMTEVSN